MLVLSAAQLGLSDGGQAAVMGGSTGDLAIGVGVGLLTGLGGAMALNAASRSEWVARDGRRIAVLAVALGAFSTALAIEGNGFIAAFVAGLAFGSGLSDAIEVGEVLELPELGGQVLALVVWFLFGATLLPIALDHLDDASVVAFAVLTLTVLRMLPVAIALAGSGLSWEDVLFVGWFGPRGLASVVFALLALEQLGETSHVVLEAVGAVALTVLLSVVLHGVSAGPAARRYGGTEQETDAAASPRISPRGFRHRGRPRTEPPASHRSRLATGSRGQRTLTTRVLLARPATTTRNL